MRFNEPAFYVFLGLFLPVFYLLKGRPRLIWLCLGSYVFYGWFDWRYIGLLGLVSFMDYGLALNIGSASTPGTRHRWVTASIIVNLGLLVVFKYQAFLVESLNSFLPASHALPVHSLALPLGISFYTFMSMSYTIDVYRGAIRPERDFLTFAAFVGFFPHLIAGPILKPSHFLPQLHELRDPSEKDLNHGVFFILLGYFKKAVVADSLSPYVDGVFSNPQVYSPAATFIAVVFYAFVIYGDFSGYSDIAYGIARLLGLDVGKNFQFPYFATSFSDFWKRWHISLSGWLRDYLYISLGGNRRGTVRTLSNLMVTMLLGGLWHGANWTFLVWGGLHGFYLCLQRGFAAIPWSRSAQAIVNSWLGRLIARGSVLFGVGLAWLFFRAQSLRDGWLMTSKLIDFRYWGLSGIPNAFWVAKGMVVIAIAVLLDLLLMRWIESPRFLVPRWHLTAWVGLIIPVLLFFGNFSGSGFIYFQF